LGQVAAAVANFGFRAPREPLRTSYFMPSWRDKEAERAIRMTRKKRKIVAIGWAALAAAKSQAG